jgi:hypothetical protein
MHDTGVESTVVNSIENKLRGNCLTLRIASKHLGTVKVIHFAYLFPLWKLRNSAGGGAVDELPALRVLQA